MRRIISISNLRFFFILILILSIFIRCDDNEIPFPEVSVNVTLALDTQLGNMLVGEYRTIDGHGLGGLIIYRADRNEFLAFDRACTYEASRKCVLEDAVSFFKCPCCESEFWMVGVDIAGSVYQGPASYPLKQYNCYFNAPNLVVVRN